MVLRRTILPPDVCTAQSLNRVAIQTDSHDGLAAVLSSTVPIVAWLAEAFEWTRPKLGFIAFVAAVLVVDDGCLLDDLQLLAQLT